VPSTNDLLNQLNALLRLTETEIMIAETRRAQAATDDIERELAANADKGRDRVGLLSDAIRQLGGVPDVLGVAVGRVTANAKAVIEQGQDVTDAMVGDLLLEHELLDRTRLAAMIAEQIGAVRSVSRVLERLETAHTATIEWLMTRLGEIAVGGPPALRPTPAQAFIGVSRRLGSLPARQTAGVVNRTVEQAGRLGDRAGSVVSTNVARTRELLDAAVEIWTAGRDASLKRSEQLAAERGDQDTARSVHRTRSELGALDTGELPIRGYDRLNAAVTIDRIRRLRDAEDVRAILAYETANKARKGVTLAARDRVGQLAAELADAS
jgi:bacterioferritin (cytochrome b1)